MKIQIEVTVPDHFDSEQAWEIEQAAQEYADANLLEEDQPTPEPATSTGHPFRKLVRDRIPEIIAAKGGGESVTYVAGDAEYAARLRDKLREEVAELLGASDLVEEMADVIEVVYAIADQAGIAREHLEAVRVAKAQEVGAFTGRIVWCGNQETAPPPPIPAESAVDPTDGDFHPDDVPDSVVIASALFRRLGDCDAAEQLADAVLVRLREYGRVVARLPSGIARAEEIHSRVIASTPEVHQDWVEAAVEEWHRVGVQEPELLLDDQMRRILAKVVPLVAGHIAGLLDELAAVVLRSAHEAAGAGAGESAARFSRRSQALADAAGIARGAFEQGDGRG